ncbi:hypothetical protein [Granulicella tundricola]|uniref:6-phosphofructokinase n=1 Tax=Granulicella tundricola (strain ATCC BAA-1859 / DSM 23138 / MP5ACTX9) TaxID=1198114 RepID=E8X774_GRATM|nr:hypothetical protein [Granulicella tundricola]ADW71308.1 6-phosphofructokinase [Granulicella tundricola MP5ACTX9]
MAEPVVLVVICETSEEAERTMAALHDVAIHAMTVSFVSEDSLNRSVRDHIFEAHHPLFEGRTSVARTNGDPGQQIENF